MAVEAGVSQCEPDGTFRREGAAGSGDDGAGRVREQIGFQVHGFGATSGNVHAFHSVY
ncbi:MAG: hypothetical protein RLZZ517_21 [Candidatus Parcubacteria bacterium]